MTTPKVIILRTAGINCDLETAHAFELAGAEAERIHINRVIERPGLLEDFHILVVPGGFSYGDDVAAGKIFANQIVHHLREPIQRFIDAGKLVMGICNGFQVLVKAGFLPGAGEGLGENPVTITYNDCGKFEDRWVYLEPGTSRSVFIKPGQRIYLPIAHGEGKVVTSSAEILEAVKQHDLVAFRYVDQDGRAGGFPINPNGSMDAVAGLTDSTGRVLGMMPHPERYVHYTQHPHWTRLERKGDGDGMLLFRNAVGYVRDNL